MSEEKQAYTSAIEIEIPNLDDITDAEREKAGVDAEEESRLADMKQHADKLLQKFVDIDNIAPHRAIWELIQNACDLADICDVVIDYTNDGFAFTHNGKAFTSSTFISLIKQVSNKGDGKEVGKFGTGFITTHAFGRKFDLDSLLQVKGKFIKIEKFRIDRSPVEWRGMVDNLREQEKHVYSLIKTGSSVRTVEKLETTFNYIPETQQEIDSIKHSINYLTDYIPLVLTLSQTLESVTLRNCDGSQTIFKKGGRQQTDDYFITTIIKNGDPLKVYSIVDEEQELEIILPLTTEDNAAAFPSSVARLFLFYPLIGTERWGTNFLIHSGKFKPTEPRDGVHLKSANGQVQEAEKINREIITQASKLIFKYVEECPDSIKNPIHFAKASFNTNTGIELLDDYYKDLKKDWVACFSDCLLVDTEIGLISPSEAAFLDSEAIADDEYYHVVYALASLFWDNLPNKEIAPDWTNIVRDWGGNNEYVTISKIAERISLELEVSTFNQEDLLLFYKYILKLGRQDLFESLSLLPNIYGVFVAKEKLVKPVNLYKSLVETAEIIIPNTTKNFVNTDFELGFQFKEYTRALLSKDINAALLNIPKEQQLPDDIRTAILRICSIFPTSNISSTRRKLVPYICEHFVIPFSEEIMATIEDDKFDHEYTPFKTIIRDFLNDISLRCTGNPEWPSQNLFFLKDCVELLHNYTDVSDIINAVAIYPNQLGKLSVHSDLSIETQFPEDKNDSEYFKDVFERIYGPVRNKLVHSQFAGILPKSNKNQKNAIELASLIEHKLKDDRVYEEITSYQYHSDIFKIIKLITEKSIWVKLFPDLDNRKEMIMMMKIIDKNVKNDLFSIIGLTNGKIATLGNLSRNPDMERIILLGEKAMADEKGNKRDFDFKKKIGVHIENLVRQELAGQVDSFNIEVKPEQGGQDMIAWLDAGSGKEMVYFIEVKSQWEVNAFVTMSYAQSRRSVKEQEQYALCTVDLVDYKVGKADRFDPEIDDVIDRMKFVREIGTEVEKLIDASIKADIELSDVRLTDEYRVKVFQNIVNNKGMSFDDFVTAMIEQLKSQYPTAFANRQAI